MRVTKEQPPMPPPEYVLRMSYPDLHNLYHDLLDIRHGIGSHQFVHIHELFAALKEHA